MALSTLSEPAMEQGTYIVTAACTDDAGSAVTPDTLTWTLTDTTGAVVNSRQDVAIETPSTSNNIVLSGDDLAVSGTTRRTLVLTVEGTYTSDAGVGLPLTDAIKILVEPLPGVQES